jgi:hypothetical protein
MTVPDRVKLTPSSPNADIFRWISSVYLVSESNPPKVRREGVVGVIYDRQISARLDQYVWAVSY